MDIIILHGTKGSPEGNWFFWLKEKLEEKGHNVYIPKLPTPEGQTKDNWNKALREQVPALGKDTIIIGHSCGATFLLNILEGVSEPVHHAIFVSVFNDALGIEDFDPLNETFINNNLNWDKVEKNATIINILHGDNDPYVPLEYSEKVAKKLGVNVTIIKNGGHLNAEAGYTQFEELLDIIN